ncbi:MULTISPECIES: hypothetical protein [unclassified Rhizobium]|uniref:hypothetical protein n=1 Tax=unclassified Rhizobium TaxID=2613769 RepID=UPI0007F10B4E|nr:MULTISPECIES: hypothetical protein [unclassified Rhizobium]ANL11984.1 hypothetical protein AMJ98_PA00038 [Rhizobium sp. N1341]ANM42829.1 hypothetical protein AMK03_PA00038 [Rhizobium sp. N741]
MADRRSVEMSAKFVTEFFGAEVANNLLGEIEKVKPETIKEVAAACADGRGGMFLDGNVIHREKGDFIFGEDGLVAYNEWRDDLAGTQHDLHGLFRIDFDAESGMAKSFSYNGEDWLAAEVKQGHNQPAFITADQWMGAGGGEVTRSLPVSNAVLDEVFEKHADAHMRSVHGLDDATPALSSEQVAQLVVQPSEEDRRSQADESFKHGFPSNFMAAEIDEFTANVEAARAYWAENPHPLNQTPSMETPSEDQVDYGPAVESVRKLRFAAMADRAEAAARDDKGGRTLETTNEQGV